MKTPRMLLLLLVAALLVPSLAAADHHEGGMGEMDEEMAAWMALGTPGEPHAEMAKMAGDWTFVQTNYWGPEPTTSEGTMHAEVMFGGRYVHAMHKGTMMGMPFEGAGLSGYDNATNEYFNVWVDSMSTGVMVSKGTMNDAGDLEMTGTMNGPGGEPMPHRMVTHVEDDDHHTFEMYGPDSEGNEQLMMKIEYTRAKM